MTFVPGGEFVMGSDDGDAFSRPAHKVKVEAFFIDVTEVTNEAYLEFVKATGHDVPFSWTDGSFLPGDEKNPVTGVTWYDAAEYAAWRGKRLPTETEWEFAARGSDGRRYPWGNEWDPGMANAAAGEIGIRDVGEGGRSPFGAFDMSGNVWEWTASAAKSFPNGKPIPWSRLKLKIIRGGNWQSDPKTATTYFRGFYGAAGEKEYKSTGFRCVKDLAKDE
jgi:formylglycine-generating enzyme required for sulfatase activity